jgi:hypothetical protein
MVPILLMTDTFRGNTKGSRWRDSVWLGWLAVPLYWVHQFEEYSLPVIGLDYSLPEMVCKNFGFPPYPACPIPLSFYPLVNIALMWFGAPLAAYLGRRNKNTLQNELWGATICYLDGSVAADPKPRLLRKRRRPTSRRAAKKCDELAPPHVAPHGSRQGFTSSEI